MTTEQQREQRRQVERAYKLERMWLKNGAEITVLRDDKGNVLKMFGRMPAKKVYA